MKEGWKNRRRARLLSKNKCRKEMRVDGREEDEDQRVGVAKNSASMEASSIVFFFLRHPRAQTSVFLFFFLSTRTSSFELTSVL